MARVVTSGRVASTRLVVVPLNPSELSGGAPTFWIKADVGTTLEGATQKVTQWNDQSGQGNHVTQATSANRPLLTAGARNGLPAIRYAGTEWLSRASCNLVGAAPYTVAHAHKMTLSGNRRVLTNSVPAGNAGMYTDITASGFRGVENPGVASHSGTQKFTLSVAEIWIATQANGSPPLLYVNNVSDPQSGGGGCSNPGASADLVVGGHNGPGNSFAGDMYEVAIFPRVISAAERASLFAYLSLRWAIGSRVGVSARSAA